MIRSYQPSSEWEILPVVYSQSLCYTLQPGPHPREQVRRPRGSSSLLTVSSPPSGLTGGGDKREQLGQDTCPHPVSPGPMGLPRVCVGSQQRSRQLWGMEERGSEVKERCDWEGLKHPLQAQPFLLVYPPPQLIYTLFKGSRSFAPSPCLHVT